jgi:hypothetical protein
VGEVPLDRVFDHRRGAAYELLWPEGSWLGNAYPHEFHALVVRPTIELLRGAIKTGVLDGSIAPMPSPVLDASTIHATFWMLAERHFDGRRITRAEAQRHMDRVVRALLVPKS